MYRDGEPWTRGMCNARTAGETPPAALSSEEMQFFFISSTAMTRLTEDVTLIPGYCGSQKLTDVPSPAVCGATGFHATRSGVSSLEMCVSRCRACGAGKCSFATYSERVFGGDCSLYASCDTSVLPVKHDYVTASMHAEPVITLTTPAEPGAVAWATARSPEESVWCPAPQPTAQLVVYNRLAKAGSSTMLSLLRASAHRNSYRIVSGDVMHERLSSVEQSRLVGRLMNMTAVQPVLFEQHIPYLSFSAVPTWGARAEPVFIQMVREPTARWVSAHYFVRSCFCDTRNGTRPPGPGQFWCGRGTEIYRMYDQSAMCVGDINVYYAARHPNRTYTKPDSNGMTNYFCGHDDVCESAEPAARKAASLLAWEHAWTRYAWVGVLEHFEESLRLLHGVLPSYMPTHIIQRAARRPVVANARREAGTEREPPPDEAALATIRAELALDIRLYERLVRLHQNRNRSCVYR